MVAAAGTPPPPPYQQPYQGQPYTPGYAAAPATSGLQENVAGLLCYLLGWLTGIVFLLIDKRPFVRFHAAQSIVVFGFLFVIRLVMMIFGFSGSFFGFWAIYSIVSILISLLTVVAWVVLMIMAYQGKWFEVPGAAGVAKNIAGKVQ